MTAFSDFPLTLDKLELVIVDVPQRESFQSAIGGRSSRQALLVIWHDREGDWGIGECSCRPDPYFSHEYLDGAAAVITQFLFPRLNGSLTFNQLVHELDRIRGWGFARATVLAAVCDLIRRKGGLDPLDAWQGERVNRIPVGISLGLYDGPGPLIEKIAASIAEGYRRIKLKIKPGLDPDYLAAVRATFPDFYLGCDANGSFSEAEMDQLVDLSKLNLAMIEQPFAPDRLDLCAALKLRAPDLSICLDEGVSELGHLITAHQLGALDELNIKPGRVGGILTAMRLAEYCRANNIAVWVGGMFETGIGRAANLRFAAFFPEALAHDLSPSARYFLQDLVEDPTQMDRQGFVPLPELPVTLSRAHLESFLTRRIEKVKL